MKKRIFFSVAALAALTAAMIISPAFSRTANTASVAVGLVPAGALDGAAVTSDLLDPDGCDVLLDYRSGEFTIPVRLTAAEDTEGELSFSQNIGEVAVSVSVPDDGHVDLTAGETETVICTAEIDPSFTPGDDGITSIRLKASFTADGSSLTADLIISVPLPDHGAKTAPPAAAEADTDSPDASGEDAGSEDPAEDPESSPDGGSEPAGGEKILPGRGPDTVSAVTVSSAATDYRRNVPIVLTVDGDAELTFSEDGSTPGAFPAMTAYSVAGRKTVLFDGGTVTVAGPAALTVDLSAAGVGGTVSIGTDSSSVSLSRSDDVPDARPFAVADRDETDLGFPFRLGGVSPDVTVKKLAVSGDSTGWEDAPEVSVSEGADGAATLTAGESPAGTYSAEFVWTADGVAFLKRTVAVFITRPIP